MKHPDLVWEACRADGRVVSCLLESCAHTHTVVQYVDEVVSKVEEFTHVEDARARVRALYAEFTSGPREATVPNFGTPCRESARIFKGWCSQPGPVPAHNRRPAGGRHRRRSVAPEAVSEPHARVLSALEVVGVGTWETDLTTGETAWSAMQEQLHGLSPGEFTGTFEAFIDVVEPDDRPRVRDATADVRRNGGEVRIEYQVTWPDGSRHWIANIGRTVSGSDQRPLKAVGIGLDVTSHKLLEGQHHKAPQLEAIGRLAGGIAHDFNNHLTAIIGYS